MTTCYAYDRIEQEHTLGGHPENRGRLATTMRLLQADGILGRLQATPVLPASLDRLQRVHPRPYIERLRQMAEQGGGQLDPDTYVVGGSYQAALASGLRSCRACSSAGPQSPSAVCG